MNIIQKIFKNYDEWRSFVIINKYYKIIPLNSISIKHSITIIKKTFLRQMYLKKTKDKILKRTLISIYK